MSANWRKPPRCKVCGETGVANFYASHRTKCKDCVKEASSTRYRELKEGLHQVHEEAPVPPHRAYTGRAYAGGINDNYTETDRSSRTGTLDGDREELSGEIAELSERLTAMDEALEELMRDVGKMLSEKDKKIQQLEARIKPLEALEARVKALEDKKTRLLDKTVPFDDEWQTIIAQNDGKIYTTGVLEGTLFQDTWKVCCMVLDDLNKIKLRGHQWNDQVYYYLLDMGQRKKVEDEQTESDKHEEF